MLGRVAERTCLSVTAHPIATLPEENVIGEEVEDTWCTCFWTVDVAPELAARPRCVTSMQPMSFCIVSSLVQKTSIPLAEIQKPAS